MSFIQNFFTSRDNNAQGNTYVGQEGRLWWDPDRNALYYSDGSTPGGIPVGTSGGNGTPSGPTNSIQYNAGGGNFGGTANLVVAGNGLSAVGNITAAWFIGNISSTGNTSFSNISVSATANLGNFTITDQTMAGTVAGRDITYTTVDGNANLNILGGFKVHSANLALEPEFRVDTNGRTRILVSDTGTFDPSFQVIGSADGSYVTPQFQGVMMHVTGQPGTPSRIYNDGASNYSVYVGRRYNGTSAAPTGVLGGQIMTRFAAAPYTIDNSWANISTTRIDFVATENQTTLVQGSKIQLWSTENGTNTPQLTAELDPLVTTIHGNVNPSDNNQFSLGNNTHKWSSIHIGPDSIFIEDSVLNTDAELTVADGVLLINGVAKIEIGNMQMTTTGISLTDSASNANLIVGETTNTGYLEIDMLGIKFKDGTLQTTAAIPLTQKGQANGVVPLNSSTKIDPIYLPAGGINFVGVWNAANNTPTLADGIGNVGDEYVVGVAGTQNLGSGNITFNVGDFVLYTSANVWVDIPVGGSGVTSFNGRSGAVTLQSSDVTNALSNGSITNNFLSNDSWSLTTGQGIGLVGNSTVELGDSITLTNTGVTAAIGGTGVSVNSATGNVTFSIGQPVGTANSVTFLSVTSNSTIQATGNITGANIATAGRIVATGNIVTSGFFVAPNTLINGGVSTTGNVIGGNLVGQNLTPTRVTFVGSGKEIDDDAEFTYNDTTNTLSVGNITATGNVNAAFFNGNGSGLTGTVGGSRYFGSFLSTTTQTNTSPGNALPMTFDTADAWNVGVQLGAPTPNSRIIMNNPGVYNIQFSAQLDKTDAGVDTVDIWLSQDGVNVPNTNTTVTLTGNDDKVVAAWNFLVQTTTANSYIELYWTSIDSQLRLLSRGTQINPTRPAVPSVILTVTQA